MILERAKRVLKQESRTLDSISRQLNKEFEKAVSVVLKSRGKVVVMGIGKSGLVGRKIAATLSSTGTPSIFLHAAEGLHGDLGAIDSKDVLLILSYSGTTDEIASMLPYIKRLDIPVISITGNKNSELAKSCDAVIEVKVEKEACPMNMVPTASTTAMLAVGDALAICVLEEKGFKPDDFAALHPGGTLGKRLLLKVDEIIKKTGVNPIIKTGATVKDAIMEMTRTRVGATCVVDREDRLLGYFTDGDLRRGLQKDKNIINKKIDEVMTENPTTIKKGDLAIRAKEILTQNEFDNLPVVDDKGKPIGIIDERDIIQEGL
ncbi:MAG: KpsF/GutQ family sugar-phosphate isomerase [Elusimicrobiota bacterium]